MLAAIRVEEKALTDPRFAILGKLMGVSKFDARARVEILWSHCTEIKSYYLAPTVIDTLAEWDGFSELICHPDVHLGERNERGIRIKGTRGRIEWLTTLRKNSGKGGEKTKAKWLAKRGPTDRPNEGPPTPVLTPTLAPVKKNNNTLLAKAKALADPLFDAFYQVYPKHVKKTEAKKAWIGIKDHSQIPTAVANYKIFIEKNQIEWKFIMHPATFLNTFEEWLEWNADQCDRQGGQLSLVERLKLIEKGVPA